MRYRLWYDKTAKQNEPPWLVQGEEDAEPSRVSEAFFRNATVITSFIEEGHALQGGPRGVVIVETRDA